MYFLFFLLILLFSFRLFFSFNLLNSFTQAAQWLDSALQDLNVAISSRMFSKIDIMFERMNEFQWQEDIKRADKIDKQNVEGDIKKLMDENEEFREEMRELLGEIQNEIKYEFRGLREV